MYEKKCNTLIVTNRSVQRNLPQLSNFHTSVCRTPKMANAVSQAVAQRQQPPREAPAAESSRREVRHADEEEDEVTCFKEVVPAGGRQLSLSSQQQRDVAVLMADTPSPAPSVISIHSDLSDGDDERDEGDARMRR